MTATYRRRESLRLRYQQHRDGQDTNDSHQCAPLRTHGFHFARPRCERSECVILCCVFYSAQLLIKVKPPWHTMRNWQKAGKHVPANDACWCSRSKFTRVVLRIGIQDRDNGPWRINYWQVWQYSQFFVSFLYAIETFRCFTWDWTWSDRRWAWVLCHLFLLFPNWNMEK